MLLGGLVAVVLIGVALSFFVAGVRILLSSSRLAPDQKRGARVLALVAVLGGSVWALLALFVILSEAEASSTSITAVLISALSAVIVALVLIITARLRRWSLPRTRGFGLLITPRSRDST